MKVLSRSWRVVSPLALVLLVLSLAACGALAPQTQAPQPEATQEVLVVTATSGPATEQPTAVMPAATQTSVVVTATGEPGTQPTTEATAAPPAGGENTGPVTSNAAWNPVREEVNGVVWMLVPTGSFTMGNRNGPQAENPEHTVQIAAPFWLMRTEVWNELYGGDSRDWTWRDPMAPAANYTWTDALAFCQSLGGRLPTEAEWEWAAKGPDSLAHPSEPFQPGFTVNGSNSTSPIPVGSFEQNASWVGALDLLGNVAEWTSSGGGEDYPYDPNDGRERSPDAGNIQRVIRGGSYQQGASDMRNSWRQWIPYNDSAYYVGFRCVRDYQP